MMEKRGFLAIGYMFALALLITACNRQAPPFECTDAIGCVTIAPNEPIKIGVLHALTGGAARTGIEQNQSIELALAERDNQLLGHPVELKIEDPLCSFEGGANTALKIVVDPQMIAILGTTCSGSAIPASEIMSEAGLVMISASNTAPSLTSIDGKPGADWHPGYLRVAHNDSQVGRAAAIFAFQELGVTRAATIDSGDAYTEGFAGAFKQVFTELGGEISLSTAVTRGESDMHPVLTAVANARAELLFFPLYQPEAESIVLQVNEIPALGELVLINNLLLDAFIESVGTDGVGMYFVGPTPVQNPADDALISKFKSRYGQPPGTIRYSYTYDAANLLFDAIESVAVQDANAEGMLHIGRQALRDALYGTTDFKGVTGVLACDEFGDCATTGFSVMRLDDPAGGLEGLESNAVYTYWSSDESQ